MQQNDARYVEQGNNDNYTLEELKPHPDPIKVLVKILIQENKDMMKYFTTEEKKTLR